MTTAELQSIPFTSDFEVPPEIQEDYILICKKIDEDLSRAVFSHTELQAEYLRERADSIPTRTVRLVTLDRSDWHQRKLDKALRQRLSSEESGNVEGVFVYPYDPTPKETDYYQSLVDIYPAGAMHVVSIHRCITSIEGASYPDMIDETTDRNKKFGEAIYSLTVDPLMDGPIFPEDASASVSWILECIASGDYQEAAQILSEPISNIQDRQLLSLLWRKLRLTEIGMPADLGIPESNT